MTLKRDHLTKAETVSRPVRLIGTLDEQCGPIPQCGFEAGPPHAVAAELDPMSVVDEAMEDGVGINRIADDLVPSLDRNPVGDDGRLAAILFFENPKEIMAPGIVERLEAPVIEK